MAVIPKISKVVSKDNTRSNLQYAIVTEDGLMVATDSYKLVVFDLRLYFPNSWERAIGKAFDINLLKAMEKSTVKEIEFANDFVAIGTRNGNEMRRYSAKLQETEMEDEKGDYDYKGSYMLLDLNGEFVKGMDRTYASFKFPNWKAVIPDWANSGKYTRVGFDPQMLLDLSLALSTRKLNTELNFIKNRDDSEYNFPERGIKVTTIIRDKKDRTYGLLMPRILEQN